MAAGLRCVTYDRRGAGQSRGSVEWEAGGSQLSDLGRLVDALHLESFAFVGTAGGTTAGILFALQQPERVRALAITCGMAVLMLPEYLSLRMSLTPDSVNLSAPVIEREIGRPYRASNPEGVRRWEACYAPNLTLPPQRQPLGGTMTLDDLAAMKTPMLFLASDEDGYAPPPRLLIAIVRNRVGSRASCVSRHTRPDIWKPCTSTSTSGPSPCSKYWSRTGPACTNLDCMTRLLIMSLMPRVGLSPSGEPHYSQSTDVLLELTRYGASTSYSAAIEGHSFALPTAATRRSKAGLPPG